MAVRHIYGVKPREEWTREEVQQKMSDNRRTGLHPLTGIPKSKERNCKAGLANTGRIFTEKQKHNMSQGQMGKKCPGGHLAAFLVGG